MKRRVYLPAAQPNPAARRQENGTPSQCRRSLHRLLLNRVSSPLCRLLHRFEWRRRRRPRSHFFSWPTFSGIRSKRSRFSAFDSSDEKGLTLEVCLFTGTSRVKQLFQSDENNLPITLIFNLKFNHPS
jgi:hypothetical protein